MGREFKWGFNLGMGVIPFLYKLKPSTCYRIYCGYWLDLKVADTFVSDIQINGAFHVAIFDTNVKLCYIAI